MQTGPLFQVGKHQVPRQDVNPELIRKMADSAPRIRVEDNPSASEWNALADRVERDDRVSPEDLKQLETLGKACFKHHKELHSDLKEADYKDRKLRAELQDVHVFQSGNDRIREAVMLAQAKVAVQALAGASFGPTGLVTAYAAYSRLQRSALEPLIHELQGFQDGTSRSLFEGNKAQGFHGDEVWRQMNTMLDGAVEAGKAGRPVEVNAQYYELTNQEVVGKLARAAEAGNKVRVNVDAGRLVAFRGERVTLSDVPDKLRSILQLASVKGDVGVSAYPVVKLLGDPGDLMHRKGLRVGDQFLLTGMNANEGSGENIDGGYLLEGPAARRLVQNFSRDVGQSAGATQADLYSQEALDGFKDADVHMGARGLLAMLDCADGPSPAGTSLPWIGSHAELEAEAKKHGASVEDLTDATPAQIDRALANRESLPLNAEGKKRFLALVDRAVSTMNSPTNRKRLADIQPPDGNPAGTTAVALADLPSEREALMITAIRQAEKFIYIPAFVMTRPVASMLVARRDEMRAQGRELDIRILADPGVYPDGGTPNEAGVSFLEEAGVPVRWALLPRSGWHDRKIHAKEILTDRGEFYGSTNFSSKGLRENWEHSGYVEFKESDPASIQQREAAKAQFMELWDKQSFELNTLVKGRQLRERSKGDKDYEVQADEARWGVVRDIIHGIESVEKASGAFVEAQARDPKVAARIAEFERQGYDEGSATLKAVREEMGDSAFYVALERLPERRDLEGLK